MISNLPPDWPNGEVLPNGGLPTKILTNGRTLDPAKVCMCLHKLNIF